MKIIGNLTSKILYKIEKGIRIPLTEAEDLIIRKQWEDRDNHAKLNIYKQLRRKAYPPIGDQLDAIWKHLGYVQMMSARDDMTIEEKVLRMGNLIKSADEMMSKWLQVKRDYPKPDDV